ncbi:MAG: hypothetical protein ACHREM_25905 [Polyangiales bacterium]
MPAPALDSLRRRLDESVNAYAARFAGHARATRDLELMRELLTTTQAIVTEIDALPNRDVADDELLKTAREHLEMLRAEEKNIAEAKNAGAHVEDFSMLGAQANFVFARYRRHFAGKSRATRDLGLLGEMIEDLTKIQNKMKSILDRVGDPALRGDYELVSTNLKLYVQERTAVADARGSGTLEQQADTLAEAANTQFAVYQDNFSGKARLTRRPQLLQRVIENLKQIKERMQALKKSGLKAESNGRNMDIIEQNLQMHINELAEVRKARAAVKLVELQGNLGGAANDIMQVYRDEFAGKPREGRSADLLSMLCDQLGEVARQMQELGRAEPNASNTKNLGIVMDNLGMLEAEYERIVEANRGPSTTVSA